MRKIIGFLGVAAVLTLSFGSLSVQPSYGAQCFYSKHVNTLKSGMTAKQVNQRLGTSGVRKSKYGIFQTITYTACAGRYDLMFVSGRLESIAGPY